MAGLADQVAVIVLNWNGLSDTLECLASFKKSSKISTGNFQLIVADNGSEDGSLAEIARQYPEVKVIDNRANLGFAEGNNRAMRYALDQGFGFILLVNNDTVVSQDYVARLLAAYQQLPEGSLLGSQIRYYAEPEKIWHFGARWDSEKNELVKLAQNELSSGWRQVLEVDQIVGCAMFFPRRTLLAVGLFEPKFFLNFEETDWCFRARAAGYRIYSIPDAVLWHKVSRSFSSPFHNTYFCSRNRLLWLRRNFDKETRRQIYCKQDLPRLGRYAVRLTGRLILLPVLKLLAPRAYARNLDKIRHYIAHGLGLFDALRGRFGNCPGYIRKIEKRLH